ncbi:MAG: 3-methyl-2-oxobutanoate hydroxymethyltransferase [Dehalococcoidia bacterium]|nr:3-methyl-2-oxobutanoate hydroxymethyltransferase [Dehalococcoidia bacterium]MSQ34915.1 3-methyl-2-oxobutanoate hydroxymethyltransferase [Dehalococcoidia bacterium]
MTAQSAEAPDQYRQPPVGAAKQAPEKPRRMTTHRIRAMKDRGEPIPMLTAYDFTAAKLAEAAGIPMILVGDSMGQVVLGYDSTIPVTVDDMVRASASVVRGAPKALIVADMPFMSYQVDAETALRNAGRLLQEGGAQAVKLEGGKPVAGIVGRLSEAGIAVMGHIGLTPQSVHSLGGYRVQGRDSRSADALIGDALAIQDAGAFALVLELIPAELAKRITERLHIPTIGIGAGRHCSGQVQVLHDVLGLHEFKPRHTRRYADLAPVIHDALSRYAQDVREGRFPADAESFFSDDTAVRQEPLSGDIKATPSIKAAGS